MTPYLRFPVSEPSQVGETRRAALRLADELGFDESRAGQVALAVNELGNNLERHAKRGCLLVGRCGQGDATGIEVISLDAGPGMADLARCLEDGYSTGGTPGTGLGAVRRLSDAFSAFSIAGQGSVILSRLRARGGPPTKLPFEVAGISLAAPGETVSGDAWCFAGDGASGRVVVADGLGHGPVAAAAADEAVVHFGRTPGTSPSQWLAGAHEVLRGTRGAAVAVAWLDATARTITFAGAGNVAGRIVSGVGDRTLLSQHGTVGLQVRKLQDVAYPWPDHACVVLHSDGITSRWNLADAPGLLQCDAAVIAAWLLRDHLRGRDDATVVVIRAR